MVLEATRKAVQQCERIISNPHNVKQCERIIANPNNFTETIIPRLWRDDLHSKVFASTSTSDIARQISDHLPSVITSERMKTLPIGKTRTIAATQSTESDESSTTNTLAKSISNTHLGSKLAGDALVAAAVTFGVSPFLTIIDRAIVESTAGTNSVLSSTAKSMKSMARNPVEYFKSPTFLMMWAVYSATYTTANAFKTLEEHSTYRMDRSAPSGTNVGSNNSNQNKNASMFKAAAFLGTTVVNSSASILKDRAYAKMFSGASSSKSVPRTTYALWMMRDLSVIGSSFLLPDLVSARMVENYNMDRDRARNLCQIGLPVLAQFVAGPFQYLGLDVYNRSLKGLSKTDALLDRSRQLSKGIAPVIAARIARIIPGYSIGGVANTKLRSAWRETLLERDVAAMMCKSKIKGTNTASIGNEESKEYATRMVALLHSRNNTWDKKASN